MGTPSEVPVHKSITTQSLHDANSSAVLTLRWVAEVPVMCCFVYAQGGLLSCDPRQVRCRSPFFF